MTQKSTPATVAEELIYSVSELNLNAREVLSEAFGSIWLSGEISNLATPSSGHIYFSLKDAQAQVRCALFRGVRSRLSFTPEDGMQVLAKAEVSLYPARGDFQLIIHQLQPHGYGALQKAFAALKNRLQQEGLFADQHKKPLPKLPQCIGVITSPTGAAIHDVLQVLKRRFAGIPVIIYPAIVQGKQAAETIIDAVKTANQRQECDVLILARGGGSLEDLWPFNEEAVGRGIFASQIPICTGIGHEVDTTIADFIADQRAATPSAAAELITPDIQEYQQQLQHLGSSLMQQLNHQLEVAQWSLKNLRQRLKHPGERIQDQAQRLDRLEQRLQLAMHHCLKGQLIRSQHLQETLINLNPSAKIQQQQQTLSTLKKQLTTLIQHQLQQKQLKLQQQAQSLDNLSPLQTLQRGYAITTYKNKILLDANTVHKGENVQVRLAKGALACQITETLD